MTYAIPRERYAWAAFGLLALALITGSAALVWQQSAIERTAIEHALQDEVNLLANIVQSDLQSGRYQAVNEKLEEWVEHEPDVMHLAVVASNGFVLAEFRARHPAPGRSIETLTRRATVRYSYDGEATVTETRALTSFEKNRKRLMLSLAGTTLLILVLLAALLKNLLARQREANILRVRTNELDVSNASLRSEITRRQRVEEALFEAKERAEVTLHSIGDAVITTDINGLIDYLNPVAVELTGWSLDEARGQPLETVFSIYDEVTRSPAESPVHRVMREGFAVGLPNNTVLCRRDGREVAVEDSVSPIRSRHGLVIGVVLVFHDVTASRELANQLSWHASHDALTGLVNRREFENRLVHALALARNDNQQHALLYLDLDQFKVVNDTCGHVAGDELLRQLSRNVQKHLRSHDSLARLGGDEFGVLLENCPTDRAVQIAESLRAVVAENVFGWQNLRFDVGVSIGIVPIDQQSADVGQLLATADMACYAAKEAGRNRCQLYHESNTELRQRHGEMLWVSQLNDALKQEGRLILYRQAIVPLGGTGKTYYEVLLRLRDPNGGVVEPDQFLPAAERYGLMSQIDRWVVAKTMEYLCASDAARQHVTAINLSGASLNDPRFVEFVRQEMSRDPALPSTICFEITETAAITKLTRAADFMRELKALGCQFALDDFGTGLSSFSYLQHLPIDYLKIDGSLVRGIVESETDFAMVQAINHIGHTLRVKTVAEYVENDAIRERLASIQVDFGQGFGIARPEAWHRVDG